MATASIDLSTFEIFARLPAEAREALASAVEHAEFPAGYTIFTQGATGDLFYAIASGECHVFVADESTNGAHGTLVATLHAGDSFGELALLGPTNLRKGTVITTAPTSVLTVSRAAYEQTMRAQHEQDIEVRVGFLRSVFLFEGWADDALRKLALVMTERSVGPEEAIVQQGGTSHAVYFIRSGTCRVIKQLSETERAAAAEARGVTLAEQDAVVEICELRSPQYFGELGMLLQVRGLASGRCAAWQVAAAGEGSIARGNVRQIAGGYDRRVGRVGLCVVLSACMQSAQASASVVWASDAPATTR